ncbi:uncharacterized protein FOMMEDRAFT_167854 [Fomitiporia mediterranea MF3/22]|uniref:uncharacterized protein n=1 Tax=Fomitiporia mediterranea (strain MF3/22) TaxID=694068 RepID=UPI0004409456|nr:uncharacterized protein FOMMEDRAFT_167854 [Fomitiporia mediterranea MF3/22]EJD02666.1 hypothetical protein FOMMEDRAFT_167854 [Fomitiporia mediterranea MF3/22]
MSRSNNGFGTSGTVPSPESIPTKPKAAALAKYVHSGVVTEVPSLLEETLSDKALHRGLKRWVHRTDTREEEDSTTIMKEMVAYLKEKSSCYSRQDKRWVPWQTSKRAPLNDRLQKAQKEEEEGHKQEKHQVKRLVRPEQEQPDGGRECEQAKQSDQEEARRHSDQPEQIVHQVQHPTSEWNVKKTVHKEKKRSSVPSVEEDIANFLNDIGNNIREIHGIDGLAFDSRVFSARFRHSFPADAGVDCNCKPGLVVLERWAVDAPDAMWSDIKTLLEVRRSRSKEAQKDAYRYLVHCVKMVFASQVNRRFVMGATVCGDIMTFFIFDRSGYLVSEAFDMNENVERVVRVVCGMLFVDEVRLGYDPTIFRDKEGWIVVKIQGEECMCAEDPLYVEKSVRGRGTACFETVYLGEPAVIKDAWVDDSRSQLEHEILEKVKDVEGIVKMVDYEIVQVPNEDDVLVNDTTSENRKALMNDVLSKTKAKWSEFATRTHWRIMLQPCGGPLEGFANLKELLLAIKDVVKCVEDLLEKKVLHRDISLRNIILAKTDPKDPTSRMRAYLIDFDYALDLENPTQTLAEGARTGTLPFMALEMLEEESSNGVPHAYYHDLESIFYVLCWICTSQEGPNNTERDCRTFDFNKSEVAKWTGAGMENRSSDFIQLRKAATVENRSWFIKKVVRQFAPYFEPIKDCVIDLRNVMVNVGSRPKHSFDVEAVKENIVFQDECRRIGISVPISFWMNIPNSQREPCDVFNTIYDIIDGTLATLGEPSLPPTCTPDAKDKAMVEKKAMKEANRMKFRKHMSIRELQEEREANLKKSKKSKESKAKEVAEEVERKKRKLDERKGRREEEESRELSEDPEHQQPICTMSDRNSLLKQAAINALVTSSSVPGLAHSGPTDLASGGPRSTSQSSPYTMPAPRTGRSSTMEPVGSKPTVNDNDCKSRHGSPAPKRRRNALDWDETAVTISAQSFAESSDGDSVASDSQKRMRPEGL